ncbi:hypothetical protein DTL70_05940, partial [Streptomyces diacarni]
QVGVSTYLALTFGTLLSSQGTDASFKTVSRVSPDVCPFGVHYFSSFSPRLIIEIFPSRFSAHRKRPRRRGVRSWVVMCRFSYGGALTGL